MARVVLALAILAVFSGMAAAQLALCDVNSAPPPPMNALVTSNVVNGGNAGEPDRAACLLIIHSLLPQMPVLPQA